jgi:hypothetical protein
MTCAENDVSLGIRKILEQENNYDVQDQTFLVPCSAHRTADSNDTRSSGFCDHHRIRNAMGP